MPYKGEIVEHGTVNDIFTAPQHPYTQALLACTVPELSALGAQLLVGAGVSSVDDLAAADPDFLVDAIAMFAASDEGERALRGQPVPDRDRLKFWIEAALTICENRTAA